MKRLLLAAVLLFLASFADRSLPPLELRAEFMHRLDVTLPVPGHTVQPGAVSQELLDALAGSSGWSWQCGGSCTVHSSAQCSMTFVLEYLPG